MPTAAQNNYGRLARCAAETRIGITPVVTAFAACHARASDSRASTAPRIFDAILSH